jgi:hypothetical protein
MEKSNDILLPEFKRLLDEGHMVEFTPQGVSMRPFIEGGRDSVLLRKCKKLKLGHIVLAKIGEQYVLHRVVKFEGNKIILQGDGNLQGQEECRGKDIIAYVVRLKGKGGVRKRVCKARWWYYTPIFLKILVLKVYRVWIKMQQYSEYED